MNFVVLKLKGCLTQFLAGHLFGIVRLTQGDSTTLRKVTPDTLEKFSYVSAMSTDFFQHVRPFIPGAVITNHRTTLAPSLQLFVLFLRLCGFAA